MEEIQTNAKELTLNGTEIHVHFVSGYPYFWVRNDGSETAFMSLFPNISEGKDGVISVLAGSSAGTMHGFDNTRQDLYIFGSGKIMVMGTYTPENPFKSRSKGGGDGGVETIAVFTANTVNTDILSGSLYEEDTL